MPASLHYSFANGIILCLKREKQIKTRQFHPRHWGRDICQFVCISVYLSVCLSIYLSMSPQSSLTIGTGVNRFFPYEHVDALVIRVNNAILASLNVSLSICLPVCLSVSSLTIGTGVDRFFPFEHVDALVIRVDNAFLGDVAHRRRVTP